MLQETTAPMNIVKSRDPNFNSLCISIFPLKHFVPNAHILKLGLHTGVGLGGPVVRKIVLSSYCILSSREFKSLEELFLGAVDPLLRIYIPIADETKKPQMRDLLFHFRKNLNSSSFFLAGLKNLTSLQRALKKSNQF